MKSTSAHVLPKVATRVTEIPLGTHVNTTITVRMRDFIYKVKYL